MKREILHVRFTLESINITEVCNEVRWRGLLRTKDPKKGAISVMLPLPFLGGLRMLEPVRVPLIQTQQDKVQLELSSDTSNVLCFYRKSIEEPSTKSKKILWTVKGMILPSCRAGRRSIYSRTCFSPCPLQPC